MTTFLRFLQFLALGTWIGSIIYLSFVVAPGVFGILSSRDQAGAIVGFALGRLHAIGVMAAILYFLATLGLTLLHDAKAFSLPGAICVTVMLLLTLCSQQIVTPRMAALRTQMHSVDATPRDNPLRLQFDRLHRVSVQLEGATLLLGLASLYFTARK
jgi:uncharacterized membrane protein